MRNNLLLGVSFSLISTLLYSIMSAIVKGYGDVLPPTPVLIFLQSIISFAWMLPVIYFNKSLSIKKIVVTKHPWLHLFRSMTSLGIIFTLYYAVAHIPLVNAMLLSNTTPLIVPFVGYLFFSQKINHKLWWPVIMGYIGVAIILNPDANLFEFASIVAFFSAISLAFTIQIVSKLAKSDSTTTIMFYFMLFSTLLSGAAATFYWNGFTVQQGLIMLVIGTLYFVSQYIGNAAMHYANAQLISALMYSNVLFSAILSVLFWGTIPNVSMLIGMVLVIAGGMCCIWIEHQGSRIEMKTITI